MNKNPNVFYDNTDSSYEMSKKEKATPYFLSYWAAWLKRPFYEDPVVPVYEYPKPRRTIFVVLILVLMLAVIAVAAIGFLGVVPELALFEKVDIDDASANIKIGVDDVVNSTLKSFSIEREGDLVFYWDALRDAENVEMHTQIAYYAIPASLVLTVLIAAYILIKAIASLTSDKRKKFPYIALILLLFSLLGVVGGAVWNGQPMTSLTGFFTRSGTNMIVGFGYLAIVGLEVLALIFSLFAYRTKASVQKGAKIVGHRKITE